MAIPEKFLSELIERTDITELCGGYVRFSKRSGGNMFGLCPFHSEKTPSFTVNSDKQMYHCFGCGKGGGAINFIMEIENIPFPEAVEFLARRAGLTVPQSDRSDEFTGKRERILALNRDAGKFFFSMLAVSDGESARQYITKRGISKEMVKKFGLGAAPDSWNSLINAMARKGYTNDEMTEAGLAKKNAKGSIYDVFRNRLMFPIVDTRGNLIGFSGRILDDGEPKYLNSPDTPVFSKSRNLFALNIAKKTKSGMFILAEGNIDVIALHQAGFDGAVASLGTALTGEQARLMSRYVKNVIIAYDSDAAGRKAALRASGLLEKTDLKIKVIDLGQAKDPDEFIKKKGADAFRILIDNGKNHIEYKLADIMAKSDVTTDDGKLRYLSAATDLLAGLTSRPEREIYGARVAEAIGVSLDSVMNEVRKLLKITDKKQRKRFETQVMRPAVVIQPSERGMRYENEYSAAAEEGIIRCLVRDPALIKVVLETGFSPEEFTSEFLKKVFTATVKRRETNIQVAVIMAELEPQEASRFSLILQKPESMPSNEKTIRDYIDKIRTEKYKSSNPEDGEMLLAYKKYREMKDVGGY